MNDWSKQEIQRIHDIVLRAFDRNVQAARRPIPEEPPPKVRDEGRTRRLTEIGESLQQAGVDPFLYLDSVEDLLERANGLRIGVGLLPHGKRATVSRVIARGLEKELQGEP